ncbi:hypothetical protein EBR25_09305 [bacterium]|nr:hypothetical protein [bacterium]
MKILKRVEIVSTILRVQGLVISGIALGQAKSLATLLTQREKCGMVLFWFILMYFRGLHLFALLHKYCVA